MLLLDTKEEHMTTLLSRLAAHAHGLRFEDLPPPVVEKVKDNLIHNLGLALKSHRLPHGQQAVRIARSLSDGQDGCTVIGSDLRAGPLDAAFANTTLMRADGLDDVLFPGGIHAGLVTMPLALALGEADGRPGRDVLAAITAGYDVMSALARGDFAWHARVPRRPTAAFGTFGAATVAARLLELDVEQTAQALGYAAHTAMGLAEGDPVTHWYSLLTRSGLMGALLAREGGVAAPTVLEGRFGFFRTFFGELPPEVDKALDFDDGRFAIQDATVKHYNGTGLNIIAIERAVDLVQRHGLTPADVAHIDIELAVERRNFGAGHAPGPYRDRAHATSSVIFWVASVVVDGRIDHDRPEHFDDPDVQALAERTGVTFVPGRPIRYARIVVITTDGQERSVEGDDHTFPQSEWLPWLTGNNGDLLPPDQLKRAAAIVADLEALDDVSDLLRYLRLDPS